MVHDAYYTLLAIIMHPLFIYMPQQQGYIYNIVYMCRGATHLAVCVLVGPNSYSILRPRYVDRYNARLPNLLQSYL